MRASRIIRRGFVGLLCSSVWLLAAADTPCRVVYDLGSSGIRAGATNKGGIAHIEFDALDLLSTQHEAGAAIEQTVAALRGLHKKADFDPACRQLGGGFSAWRLALKRDAETMAKTLGRIEAASSVAIMVIPQAQEGAYGYQGAQLSLGKRLETSHVLDIGGGSLQISGKDSSFGDELGQKRWQAELCRALERWDPAPCMLQPMTASELAKARALLGERLTVIGATLPGAVTMTSISRPVSRGIHPALMKLGVRGIDAGGFGLPALAQAIEMLRGLDTDTVSLLTGVANPYVNYLLSDLLLVEGLLRATGGNSLRVAEIDLTNVPGLMADEHALAWSTKYGCYLERLRSLGLRAYATDPASCD